jgi:hypothetical protein
MVTRDEDDPRNKEEGEMGPGGVRMVVMRDLRSLDNVDQFIDEMLTPGSRMYDEVSKMKVGKAAELPGGLDRGSWHPRHITPDRADLSASLTPLLPLCLPDRYCSKSRRWSG